MSRNTIRILIDAIFFIPERTESKGSAQERGRRTQKWRNSKKKTPSARYCGRCLAGAEPRIRTGDLILTNSRIRPALSSNGARLHRICPKKHDNIPYLPKNDLECFVLGGDSPLTYTQVRRMCERIQRDTGFEETISPRRFRTTVSSI